MPFLIFHLLIHFKVKNVNKKIVRIFKKFIRAN